MTTNVLHISRVGFIGGAERVILTLASSLAQSDYKMLLTCPDGDLLRAAQSKGIPTSVCEFDRMRITANPALLMRYPLVWFARAKELFHICLDNNIRAIHAHHPVGILYAIPTIRRLGIPAILHVHEMLPTKPLYALALRLAINEVSSFICVSNAAHELLRAAKVDERKISVIFNGVDQQFLDATTPAPEVKGAGPHFGVFGVIEPRKGQDIFLTAAAKVAERFPTAHFWVVGPLALKDKLKFAKKLESLANVPALKGRVTFTGYRGDVARWMSAMDVVTLTSVAQESLGMVLLEALTLGKPTIGTRIGVVPEIIEEGITGRVVVPGDPLALAEAMTDILASDLKTIAERAAAHARERFSAEIFCRDVTRVYDQLLRSANLSIML
jgi:glycosyltransferase involved in cell wall biosynthesis